MRNEEGRAMAEKKVRREEGFSCLVATLSWGSGRLPIRCGIPPEEVHRKLHEWPGEITSRCLHAAPAVPERSTGLPNSPILQNIAL